MYLVRRKAREDVHVGGNNYEAADPVQDSPKNRGWSMILNRKGLKKRPPRILRMHL